MNRLDRLRVLRWLTVLVPAVCAGLYETIRHSLVATEIPTALGTAIAVAVVLAVSYIFARVAFGMIRQMEARLLQRNRELEALTREVERLAVLEERERLSREMHDGIAQVLAYLLVRLDTIESLVERGRTKAAVEEVERLRTSGQEAYAEVREAIAGLRTRPEPGPNGLAAALRDYTAQFTDRTGIAATFEASEIDPTAGGLPPTVEFQLIRIAQEALANVRKHAGAGHVDVRFWHETDGWHLAVRDDGAGFDPAAPRAAQRQHFGLEIMRERAASLGGAVSVTSSPGSGATVHVCVPCRAAGETERDVAHKAPNNGRAAALAR
ncbi:MAG: sensor histidine kinase [Chloroflexi bacterium]|nr:sensor histidine kinase [Chloroflexota bacterium]